MRRLARTSSVRTHLCGRLYRILPLSPVLPSWPIGPFRHPYCSFPAIHALSRLWRLHCPLRPSHLTSKTSSSRILWAVLASFLYLYPSSRTPIARRSPSSSRLGRPRRGELALRDPFLFLPRLQCTNYACQQHSCLEETRSFALLCCCAAQVFAFTASSDSKHNIIPL